MKQAGDDENRENHVPSVIRFANKGDMPFMKEMLYERCG